MPVEFASLLRMPPSQRSFMCIAETDPFFEFKKSPGVVIPPLLEVERSYPEMSEPRACASKVIVYGNSNPTRYWTFKSFCKVTFCAGDGGWWKVRQNTRFWVA